MSRRIQITVDDQLGDVVKVQAGKMGLSVSSFARLALIGFLKSGGHSDVLDRAIADLKAGRVEGLSLAEFNKQVDE